MPRKKLFHDEDPIDQRPIGTAPARSPLQVSELIELLNTMLSAEPVVVEGEVSGLNVSQGKWVFFDLKDATSKVSCFMMTYQLYRLAFQPVDGSKVIVTGVPKLFSKSGKFVITVEALEPAGEGELARAFALLKQQLDREGLFAPERKRALPRFVERIALITSPESAAYTDFLRILGNRSGGLEVSVLPVAVQGQDAVSDIMKAFHVLPSLVREHNIQAVVLTRGGGSLEDLHAFNTEEIARAIYASPVPVISAIGHERDISIADLVADVRAATPSNAAEILVPDRREVNRQIDVLLTQMVHRLEARIDAGYHLIRISTDMAQAMVHRRRQETDAALQAISRQLEHRLSLLRSNVVSHSSLLASQNPKKLLDRGYSIVRIGGASGAVLTDAQSIKVGDTLTIEPRRGRIGARVEHLENPT